MAFATVLLILASGFVLLTWIAWHFFIRSELNAIRGGRQPAPGRPGSENTPDQCSGTSAPKRNGPPAMLMLIGLSLLTPVLAIAVMLSMAEQYVPEPLIALASYRGSHVRTVLTLEKLVPPPPLPPAVFLNTERPNLETADRDWNRLHPDFLQQALRVFARMEARGFPLALLEGYRSPERQDRLADMGAHVTQARAFQSKHQFGQALDAAPLRQGQLVISERDPWAMQAYQALGEEADREGLIWGGRWSMKDYGHIESAQGRR